MFAPSAASGSALERVRCLTLVGIPTASRLRAIGIPMGPSPSTETVRAGMGAGGVACGAVAALSREGCDVNVVSPGIVGCLPEAAARTCGGRPGGAGPTLDARQIGRAHV